ncbi:MAG TPA: SMP-30/gluconolactonase/LRE family protein [Lacunisphaera sp.]|jgi:sugar lactone lactonase YvrE
MSRSIAIAAAPSCVLRHKAIVGESPLWHAKEQRLYWIDIQKRKLHRFNPSTGRNESFSLPEIVTSFAFRKNGGLLLTLKKSFALFDPGAGQLQRIGAVDARLPNNRFNDGKCDPGGNYWAGTMNAVKWKAPSGHLFRIDPERKIRTMRSKVVCSNGCGWSPDGRTFYHTESFRYAIYAYDFSSRGGTLSRRRVFARVNPRSGGFPDGMTVDEKGFVWSCVVGLGQIWRHDPGGKVERVLSLPVPRATDCAFGGVKLDTLYITTARETMSARDLKSYPLSGSLFACKPGVQGMPANVFPG